MNNNKYLVGVYKEVAKNPDIIKIKNDKVYLEKLLDGEYANQDYDDYTILYKRDSENLLANVYVDQYSKIGCSLKGKIFAVAKDENGNFKSLNKEQAKKCITFFLREAFNYKNFDENGKYIPRSKRKNKNIFKNKNQTQEKQEIKQVQEKAVPKEQPQPQKVNITDMAKNLNVSNEFFEKNFRVEKVEENKEENNTSKANENANTDTKQQSSTNVLQPPIIKLSDEQTLNMILKITFIILDFVKGALEEAEDDE